VERLNQKSVCFTDVSNLSSPMQVTLVAPAGSEQVADAHKVSGGWLWQFTATPDLPLGTYSFVARLPDVKASGQPLVTTGGLEIVRASLPVVYQVERGLSESGFRIELAGFPPGSLVAVFLYGPPDDTGGLPFVRALPAARIDGGGEGGYSWQPESADRPGQYGIWLNPTPAECLPCASFSIS